MTQYTLMTASVFVVGSVLLTVAGVLSVLLLYAYRALVPVDSLAKRVLQLEGVQDELERQIDVVRKSQAGRASAVARKKGQRIDEEAAETAESLRARVAAGGA